MYSPYIQPYIATAEYLLGGKIKGLVRSILLGESELQPPEIARVVLYQAFWALKSMFLTEPFSAHLDLACNQEIRHAINEMVASGFRRSH